MDRGWLRWFSHIYNTFLRIYWHSYGLCLLYKNKNKFLKFLPLKIGKKYIPSKNWHVKSTQVYLKYMKCTLPPPEILV